ncbi:hypothetical protein I4U23_013606 [Adineta vaga]|nr:hypothetical protein I4U23_013606 [Adineta vaga]
MSTSMDYELILTLISIQERLYRFGGPILMILGTISNLFSILVFTQKLLRKNPCSIYFMAFNIANLMLIYASFLPPVLEIGYNIQHTSSNLVLCRLRLYVAFVFNCLCPSYLILASIDRVMITSANAQLIPGTISCYLQLGSYTVAVTFGSCIKEITTPILMVILGLWTVKNTRRTRHARVIPSNSGAQISQSKDRQLVSMVLTDIIIYILFSLVMTISLMYRQFTQNQVQGLQELIIQGFIGNVAMYSAHIPFCITSYAHLLLSKTFRNELKSVIIRFIF